MKRKRYPIEQIVVAVKQHDLGTPAADIARNLGIAEQTFYRWTKQYGGLEPRAAPLKARASVVCAFSRYK